MTVLLAGCFGQMSFPVGETAQQRLAEQNINIIRITPDNIAQFREAPWVRTPVGTSTNPPTDPVPYVYRVGSGDQLRIQTWTSPERIREEGGALPSEGPVVNEAGEFFYPFVGTIRAAGRTVSEIRADLTQRLRSYIADPQVEVEVEQFGAHRVTITGSVSTPGPTVLTNVPTRLLDLVNSAGAREDSDLRQVVVRRGGREHVVNLFAFMQQGRANQNPVLLPGDVVFVPPMEDNKVFTFGEISVGEVSLGPARRTLTEILADAGGISRTRSDPRGVFVFRRNAMTPDGFDVFQFNLREATALVLTSEFAMAPLDIVFVTNDPVTRWNDTVGRLISPVSGFVQARRLIDEL